MKFKKLTKEFVELLDRKDKGKKLKSKKVKEVLSSLAEKKAGYEKKLESELGEKDRHVLEVKLKVVDIQIDKLRKIAADDDLKETT